MHAFLLYLQLLANADNYQIIMIDIIINILMETLFFLANICICLSCSS